jgi:hypothetical protein
MSKGEFAVLDVADRREHRKFERAQLAASGREMRPVGIDERAAAERDHVRSGCHHLLGARKIVQAAVGDEEETRRMPAGKRHEGDVAAFEGRLPGLELRHMSEIGRAPGQRLEHARRALFPLGPFVPEVVDLPLGEAQAERHGWADRRAHGLQHFQGQTEASDDVAAPPVPAMVGVVGEELIQEIAVGAVDLDAVETGDLDRQARGTGEALYRGGDLCFADLARDGIGAVARGSRSSGCPSGGRPRDRLYSER